MGLGTKEELGGLMEDRQGWRQEDLFSPFKAMRVLRFLEKEDVQYDGRMSQTDQLFFFINI